MSLPFVWDAPRPFVHPLTTPAGAVLSVEAPDDHPWHHALWFTIKFVNGENFWEEYGEFGTLRTQSVEQTAIDGDGAETTAQVEWIAPDGSTTRLTESRTVRATPIDADAYAIDWSEELIAPVDTVLDRTPFTTWGGYGGLTLRGAPSWTDTVLRLDDGIDRDRCLGDRSTWLAIHGTPHEWTTPSRSEAEVSSSGASQPTDGHTTRADEQTVGVVFFDHPENVRAPSPWYASTRADTYGAGWANFVNAAFLWDDPLELSADTPLRLRYRVIVHDHVWSVERIRAGYERWSR